MTAPKKKKILILQPGYHENSHHWSDLVEQIILAFDPQRYDVVSAFFHGRPESEHPQSRAAKAIYFNFPEDWSDGLRLKMRRALSQFLAEERFDAVICNRYKPVSLMMDLAPKLGIKACIGISHSFGEYGRWWRRFRFARSVDERWRFVGVSVPVRDYLVGLGCGFTTANTVAINNAIDIEEAEKHFVERTEARKALGLPEGSVIVGAAGRLVSVKAHDVLIRAFARVAGRHPSAMLAVMGEGKKRPELEQLIADLGVAQQVRLLGFVAGAKRYLKGFDIWTMPSLKEGLGLALLEGMIAKLPVIASEVPAMSPIVRGADGYLVPPGNEEALANAIDTCLRLSKEDRAEAGLKSFRFVREAHSIKAYHQAYRDLVEAMLERG